MQKESAKVSELLQQDDTHIYVCGLKGMESGVENALEEICLGSHIQWQDLKTSMRASGRYHVETY